MNKLEDLISYADRLLEECDAQENCHVCPISKICDKIGDNPLGLSTVLKYLAECDLKKSIEEIENKIKGGQN